MIDGPWTYGKLDLDDWGVVRDANGAVVCQVRNPERSEAVLDKHRANGTDPCEDKARLVAAAPELLAALKKAQGKLRYLEVQARNKTLANHVVTTNTRDVLPEIENALCKVGKEWPLRLTPTLNNS